MAAGERSGTGILVGEDIEVVHDGVSSNRDSSRVDHGLLADQPAPSHEHCSADCNACANQDNYPELLVGDPTKRDELVIFWRKSAIWLANILTVLAVAGDYYAKVIANPPVEWSVDSWVVFLILGAYGGNLLDRWLEVFKPFFRRK